jgi:hypothetical protein
MGGNDFFQVKDVFWTLLGVVLGGIVGWFISLWFYRRQARDTAREMARGGQERVQQARRGAQRIAERLWEAVRSGSFEGVEAARRELEACRSLLITTDQEALVDAADAAIDDILDWFGSGAPAEEREDLGEEIHGLYVRASGNPEVLTALGPLL